MKLLKKSVIVSCCLSLIASISITAFCASEHFFTKESNGFSCTGSGTISSTSCSGTFNAKILPNQPVLPSEQYSCRVMVAALDNYGNSLGVEMKTGNLSVTARVTAPKADMHSAGCSFTFEGEHLGIYTMFN